MNFSSQIWLFIIFGILGVFGEVLYAAIKDLIRHGSWQLQGHSYIWMIPVYGLLAFLFNPLANQVSRYPWLWRGVIYMVGIYAIEYVTGALLKRITGGHVWQYTGRFNLHGHIQLFPHAPIWFGVGLLVEKYFPLMKQLSIYLSSHI